jgi:hypothetical protein
MSRASATRNAREEEKKERAKQVLALLLPLSVTSAQQKATSGDGALKAVM